MEYALCKHIRELRVARNLSQVDFAKALGVSKQTVSNWENDNIQPSLEMFVRIAEFLGVTPNQLLGFETVNTLDVSGLSLGEIAHISMIVDDLRERSE